MEKGRLSERRPFTTVLAVNSPDELPAELPDARIAGIRDVAEASVTDIPTRIQELCVVENVEELRSNLEVHGLGDGNHLAYAQIGVVESRPVKESPVRCAERPTVSTHQNPRRR